MSFTTIHDSKQSKFKPVLCTKICEPEQIVCEPKTKMRELHNCRIGYKNEIVHDKIVHQIIF